MFRTTKGGSAEPPFVSRPYYIYVPRRGLEPPRVSPHAPQAGQSTNFCTWAFICISYKRSPIIRNIDSIFKLSITTRLTNHGDCQY